MIHLIGFISKLIENDDFMEIEDFKKSLQDDQPSLIDAYLVSLWHDKKGNWDMAHEIVDALDDAKAARIHAYLHRKEGDLWNADYWYRRADAIRPDISLDEEWELLLSEYLNRG